MTRPTAPVRISPRLSRNMAPTVITAGLANPAVASLGVRMPLRARTVNSPREILSTGTFPEISRARAEIRIRVTS